MISTSRKTVLYLWTIACLPGLQLSAQQPSSPTLALESQAPDSVGRRIVPIHTAPPDEGVAYGIWGAGADYKVSFHDGMTFVPYLGAQYPHNQPFAWTTESIRIGANELLHEPPRYTALAAARLEAHPHPTRFEYDLGSATEAYDLRVDGLEQTFVIERAPAQNGDLVVSGRITSQLTTEHSSAAHQALQFVDHNGDPVLSYGEAFAVDAADRKVKMTTEYRDGVISLVLPASDLANMTFPVVVDPLVRRVDLGWFGQIRSPGDCVREDEQTTHNLWYVYSQFSSASDGDLFVSRYGDRWQGNSRNVFFDLTGSWSSSAGSIASVAGANRTLTAFQRRFPLSSGSTTRIRYHAHSFSNLNQSTAVGYILVPGQSVYPKVGGTASFSSGTVGMVVFQNENNGPTHSRVYAVPVDVAGTGQGTVGAAAAHGHSGFDNELPEINKQSEGGLDPRWIVAFQSRHTGSNDDWDVGATAINNRGRAVCPILYTEDHAPLHKYSPRVSGQNGDYAVAYSIDPISPSRFLSLSWCYDIRVRHLVLSRDQLSWSRNLSSLSELGLPLGRPDEYFQVGALAANSLTGRDWLLTYYRVHVDGRSCHVARIGNDGQYRSSEQILAQNPGSELGGISFDDDHEEFVWLYRARVSDPDGYDLVGAVWAYPKLRASQSGPGTGSSCSPGILTWSPARRSPGTNGPRGPGVLRVEQAPWDAIHFVAVSMARADAIVGHAGVGGPCRLLVSPAPSHFLGFLPVRSGANPTWQPALPAAVAGETFYLQDWHCDLTSSQLLSTHRVELTVGQ